jgi:hypothetical protein
LNHSGNTTPQAFSTARTKPTPRRSHHLAIIGLQLIFLITSDALTNLRNDGNDKQRDERRRMTAGNERMAAAARFTGGGGSPVAGGEEGRVAGLPLPLAHLLAMAASGGDGGGGGAAWPEVGRRWRRVGWCGGGATRHERPRERGQTKEGDEGMLYISLD